MGAVGHDIYNLAAALRGAAQLMEMAVQQVEQDPEASVAELRESLQDLMSGVETIVGYSAIINKLSKGAAMTPEKRAGDFSEAVRKAAAYIEATARSEHQIGLSYQIESGGPRSLFDTHYINRIVQNLVGNAVKATVESVDSRQKRAVLYEDERGPVYGEVVVRYSARDDYHFIEVKDSGMGMTEATKRKILGGTAGSGWSKSGGTGWGTRTVIELTAAHGGHLEIESTPGEGSIFRVFLPFEPASTEVAAHV
jgi:signal transduction histidine kinase